MSNTLANTAGQAFGSGNITYTTYTTSYPATVGPEYTIYPVPQYVYMTPPESTKAEQFTFQKAVLRAELREFCKTMFERSICLALWANSAYSLACLICGVKISIGTTWMIFGLIPLMALAAKQRILAWGERFLS